MLKNNKGFSLMEMLGAVAILGILSTIAVAATTKYLSQSREKSYKLMSQTIYQATENCILKEECDIPGENESVTISTEDLIAKNFLTDLKNPIRSKANCNGSVKVTVTKNTETMGNDLYEYEVILNCEGIKQTELTWPEARTN